MTKLCTKKEVDRLALLFALTYMISYITRINYGAIVAEMEGATQLSKSMLSMALTGSFITYGAGQILTGIFGDRLSPKKLVSCGFIITILMNILIPICNNPYQMLAVWSVNGFAQAFMWPPMVKLMVNLLSDEDYKNTTVKVSWGAAAGTIAVYLISPILILYFGWKSVFVFSAICAIVMLVLWNKFSYEVNEENTQNTTEEKSFNIKFLLNPVMILVMAAIALQGMLRDGTTTWMPSYIAETYSISSEISILTGVILPIFHIVSTRIALAVYVKKFKNPVSCAGIFFAAGAVGAIMLIMTTGRNAAVSILSMSVLNGCMHGVNTLFTCMMPPFFYRYGRVSTMAGILNACVYIGSAMSTYVIAIFADKYGWNFNLISWLVIALGGALICFACAKPWAKRYIDEK